MAGLRTALSVATLAVAASIAPAAASASVEATVIADTGDLLTGPDAAGQLGDLLIRNDRVAFVIEAAGNHHGYGVTGGHVLDAASAPGWTDEIDHVFAQFAWFPRQAAYDSVWVEADGTSGTAVIAAEGFDSGDPHLEIATRYTLGENDAHLTIETVVVNAGTTSVAAHTFGDMIIWGSTDNFAPGEGSEIAWETTATLWLAGIGSTTSYGYASEGTAIAGEHGETWSGTVAATADLGPGGSATLIRYLVPGEGPLSGVTDTLHEVASIETGTAEGRLIDGETDLGVPDAVIGVRVGEGELYTWTATDGDGEFAVTLPPDAYTFEASADGYFAESDGAIVTTDQTIHVDITLWPISWSGATADTLTYVMRPIISIPAIVERGDGFTIEAAAPESTTNWAAALSRNGNTYDLTIADASYDQTMNLWMIGATVPTAVPVETYDLCVEASGGVRDTVAHSVRVESAIPDTFYFVHVTDTHLPTHKYYWYEGADRDSSEMVDYREVIDDINIINPAFVLHTGDLVNEGELEEFLDRRYYTRSLRITKELDPAVFMVAGNHDIGGWGSTPPPDGTARRAWWRFFGWRYLYDPPEGYGLYTQNFTFDYGRARFIGMEAYDNYDSWRYSIYGAESFTGRQMAWLSDQLALVSPETPTIAFYHYDFDDELDVAGLGIDCALWGHIHQSTGSTVSPPFNISTDQCCDGARSYRLVRVAGDVIAPSVTIQAGSQGERLSASYDPANDGSASTVTATVVNLQPEPFEHGLLKFVVPADRAPYEVEGGTLAQTIIEGDDAICYVDVAIPRSDTLSVTIRPDPNNGTAVAPVLRQTVPNPARRGATIAFVLPYAADVTLEVFDVAGRKVKTLLRNVPHSEGPHSETWDLNAADGRSVASGVYLYRLSTGDDTVNRKMVVLR